MSAHIKYQGKEKSRNRSQQIYKQTYEGLQSQIDAITIPAIGTKVTGKGYFTGYRKIQQGGPYWHLQMEYSVDYGSSSFNNTDDQTYGRKSSQLSVRNLQLVLEKRPNYKTNWNYYLLGLGNAPLPSWWATAVNTILSDTNYRWVKSASDCPTEKTKEGKYWKILKEPTKPRSRMFLVCPICCNSTC